MSSRGSFCYSFTVARPNRGRAKSFVGPATRVIDAGGRLVVPGFNDAHVHFIAGAEELIGVDLRPSRDEADMARRLGAYAATLTAGEWITGGYWDHEAWPDRSLPTRRSNTSWQKTYVQFWHIPSA